MNESAAIFRDYVRIFYKYKYLMIVIFVISISLGFFVASQKKDLWSARASIIVNYQSGGISSPLERYFMSSQLPYLLETYIRTLKADTTLQETIKRLDLKISPKTLKSLIIVTKPERTQIIEIRIVYSDPEMAAKIINTLIEVYLELHLKFITEDATNRRKFIEGQLKSVEADLKASEEDLKNFKLQENLIDVQNEISNFVTGKNSLETTYIENKIRLITIEESLKQIEKILSKNAGVDYTAIASDSEI
ncbi:hypothetical protein KAU33_11250, partial [Candidatus Dependentiae bacterium]|nr:hypothetical protein [Candidatus Dependentiae bacterium]